MTRKNSPAKQDHPNSKNGSVVSAWSGPLPPPSLFESYDEILPGSAERILSLTERETQHRHDLEMAELKANISFARSEHRQVLIGQIFAFIIAMTFIVGGLYLVSSGAQLAGTFLSSVGVVGIVAAFLKSSPRK